MLLGYSTDTNAGGISGDGNVGTRRREAKGGDSGEGFLGGGKGSISFWCPVEGDRLASLARLEHGIERLEKKGIARDEAVVIIYHPQEFLQLALRGRLGELLNSLTL